MTRRHTIKGFTLIELIVVIGIIAILAAIVIIAVNPARQFAQARNTQRRSDTLAVLNAIHQYAADNNGVLPSEIPAGVANCGTAYASTAALDTGVAPASTVPANDATLTTKLTTYVTSIPKDPTTGTGADYVICQNTSGRVTVYSRGTETSVLPASNQNLIMVTR